MDMDKLIETAGYAAPRVLPALVAFLIAPPASLRFYLASQQLAIPKKSDDKKSSWLAVTLKTLLFVGFLSAEFYILSTGTDRTVDAFLRTIFVVIYQFSLLMFLGEIFQSHRWTIHRRILNKKVLNVIRVSEVKKLQAWLVFGLATSIQMGAYFDNMFQKQAGAIISLAVLYKFLIGAQSQRISIRWTIIWLMSWLAVTAISSGALIAATIQMDLLNEDSNNLTNNEIVDEFETPFSNEIYLFARYFINPMISAAGPAFLAAVCYRFDYAQHVKAQPDTPAAVGLLSVVEAPQRACGIQLSEGVCVPPRSRAMRRFEKPFYAAAVLGWMTANVGAFLIWYWMDVPAVLLDSYTWEMIVVTLAIPAQTVALILAGLFRGELKSMWKYTEGWVPTKVELEQANAEGSIYLPEKVETETAPAYSDSVDAAPAYQIQV